MSDDILEIRLGGHPWDPVVLIHATCEDALEGEPYTILHRHQGGEGDCWVCEAPLDEPPRAGEGGG